MWIRDSHGPSQISHLMTIKTVKHSSLLSYLHFFAAHKRPFLHLGSSQSDFSTPLYSHPSTQLQGLGKLRHKNRIPGFERSFLAHLRGRENPLTLSHSSIGFRGKPCPLMLSACGRWRQTLPSLDKELGTELQVVNLRN